MTLIPDSVLHPVVLRTRLTCRSGPTPWQRGVCVCVCPGFEGRAAFPCCRADRQPEDDTVWSTSPELALRSWVPSYDRLIHTWNLVSQFISEMGPW